MIFKTRFGTLELPKDDCITCIYTGRYMACSSCDFRWGLREDAIEPFFARQKAIQESIE